MFNWWVNFILLSLANNSSWLLKPSFCPLLLFAIACAVCYYSWTHNLLFLLAYLHIFFLFLCPTTERVENNDCAAVLRRQSNPYFMITELSNKININTAGRYQFNCIPSKCRKKSDLTYFKVQLITRMGLTRG